MGGGGGGGQLYSTKSRPLSRQHNVSFFWYHVFQAPPEKKTKWLSMSSFYLAYFWLADFEITSFRKMTHVEHI